MRWLMQAVVVEHQVKGAHMGAAAPKIKTCAVCLSRYRSSSSSSRPRTDAGSSDSATTQAVGPHPHHLMGDWRFQVLKRKRWERRKYGYYALERLAGCEASSFCLSIWGAGILAEKGSRKSDANQDPWQRRDACLWDADSPKIQECTVCE